MSIYTGITQIHAKIALIQIIPTISRIEVYQL